MTTAQQISQLRLAAKILEEGLDVQWFDSVKWHDISDKTVIGATACCHLIRIKPPEKSIYQIAFEEGKCVQWRHHCLALWRNYRNDKESPKHIGGNAFEWRILEPDNQPKKTMTAKEYLKKQHGDQYENKEYHWTGLESAWIAGYEEAMGVDPRTINVDPFSPWREKQKRGEKFEYMCPKLDEDWIEGKLCAFNPNLEYEFRESPVKEPVPLGPEDVMPGLIVRMKGCCDKQIITIVQPDKVYLSNLGPTCYWDLMDRIERLVNGQWQPCSK